MICLVRWQLVGRFGQPLDGGCIGECFCGYGDATAAVMEFLRPYPEVSRCPAEGYWLARRSRDADLAVWIWIEHRDSDKGDPASERPDPAKLSDRARVPDMVQPA